MEETICSIDILMCSIKTPATRKCGVYSHVVGWAKIPVLVINAIQVLEYLLIFFNHLLQIRSFFCMLFTRYRSHIQDKRMVHLSNCKLSLKSQTTYWAKVLLIAACPSAQHPKSLIPPAEENDNHFEACRKLVERTVLSHQKSSVDTDFELAGPRKIHLPQTHLHKSTLPGSDLPSAIARRQECCLGRLSGCPHPPHAASVLLLV